MRSEVHSFLQLVIQPNFPTMRSRLRRSLVRFSRAPMGRAVRSLQDKLLMALVLLTIVLAVTIAFRLGLLATQQDRANATADLDVMADLMAEVNRGTPELLAQFFTSADLDASMDGERQARFDAIVQSSLAADPTARVRLWRQDGTVLYSNNTEHLTDRFAMPAELLAAWQGEKGVRITLRTGQTNSDALIATYTPLQFSGEVQPQGVLEIQRSLAPSRLYDGELNAGVANGNLGAIRQLSLLVLGVALLCSALALLVWRGRRTIRHLHTRLNMTSAYLQTSNALLREVREQGPLQNSAE